MLRISFSIALLAIVAAPAVAQAGGVVLAVEGDEVYVDLGAEDGVGAGAELRLLHIVIAKDPITKETLRDRFAIGTLVVRRAGEEVSVAALPEALQKRVAVGDEVELASDARTFVDPWRERIAAGQQTAADEVAESVPGAKDSAARARAARAVADAEAVRAVWEKTLGGAPAQRIVLWQELLEEQPKNHYAAEIQAEIASLRQQIVAAEEVDHGDPVARRATLRANRLAALDAAASRKPIALRPPEQVYEGNSLALAFAVLDPAAVERAWLYVRAAGVATFDRFELVHDGDAYLRGTIPEALVRPPAVELFVEVAAPGGEPQAVFGGRETPVRIGVDESVDEEAPPKNRSRITALADYVDFDGGFQEGFDQYYQAELDFTYRFIEPVYAVRLGFGTLSGTGGPKDVIDDAPNENCVEAIAGQQPVYRCRRVSFSYVYTEIEHRFRKNIAVMIRPQAGLLTSDTRGDTPSAGRCATEDTSDCEFFTGFGMRARVRLGEETATNLTLGLGFTDGVGTVFEAAYAWNANPKIPVLASVQVTDLPVPENFGVRLIVDVGYRELGWFYPSARVSYQARDVDHAGFSGGMAMNFDW